MTAYALLEDHDGWVAAAVFGASSFVFFGAYAGWAGHRARSRWRTTAGLDLDDDQLLIVHRAMTTGPVPSDPRLRVAAVNAATYDLARLDGPWVGVAFMLLFPVVIVFRVYDSWWWALLVPLYLYGVHQVWATPRRLRTHRAAPARAGRRSAGRVMSW